jgi:hypothetical protein
VSLRHGIAHTEPALIPPVTCADAVGPMIAIWSRDRLMLVGRRVRHRDVGQRVVEQAARDVGAHDAERRRVDLLQRDLARREARLEPGRRDPVRPVELLVQPVHEAQALQRLRPRHR